MTKLGDRPNAVITGGGSGLGRAFALAIARRGGHVMIADLIADLNAERAAEAAELVAQAGGVASVQRCDIGDSEDVRALAEASVKELGRFDLLANNAGLAVAGQIGDATLEDWERALRVNLWGVIYGCHAFVPTFRAQRSGHVLNVASAAGIATGIATLPEMGPYNVGEAGVIALSETLEAELAAFDVGVSVLCPTFFPTNLMESFRGSDKDRAKAEAFFKRARATAESVADYALRGVDKGEFVLLPQTDAKLVWRGKRLSPSACRAMQRYGLADRFLR